MTAWWPVLAGAAFWAAVAGFLWKASGPGRPAPGHVYDGTAVKLAWDPADGRWSMVDVETGKAWVSGLTPEDAVAAWQAGLDKLVDRVNETGSELGLCTSCHIVHRRGPGDYAACLECGHVWRTEADWIADVAITRQRMVAELRAEFTASLTVPMPRPEDVAWSAACPFCMHDVAYISDALLERIQDHQQEREPAPQDPPW